MFDTVEDSGGDLPIGDFLDAIGANEDVGFMHGGVEYPANR